MRAISPPATLTTIILAIRGADSIVMEAAAPGIQVPEHVRPLTTWEAVHVADSVAADSAVADSAAVELLVVVALAEAIPAAGTNHKIILV